MKLWNLIRQTKNRITLRTQLAVLIVSSFSIIIVPIIGYTYYSNTNTIIKQQISTLSRLLILETQILDNYFSEIDRYSLLMRHDATLMNILNQKQGLTYSDEVYIQDQLRSNFDSRNDLKSFRFYMVNSSYNYEIESQLHKVRPYQVENVLDLPDYSVFTRKRYYKSIQPSQSAEEFIRYFRTIIKLENQKPLAIVELTFDTSFVDSLARDHQVGDEVFCIVDNVGRVLYNSSPILMDSAILKGIEQVEEISDHGLRINIMGTDYLGVYNLSSRQSYILYRLIPLNELDRQIGETRNISFLIGFAAIVITTLLSALYIRLVTNPLSILAANFAKVGSGNFSRVEDIGGSIEIIKLADSFNTMTAQIDDLIKKTYISAINEKTAQLIALEAQLNPHMLYNTLQAISAEAIVNKQMKINFMITALASMLRYSFKDGEYVALSYEIKHVQDYLLLQKARFDEKLSYELRIEKECEELNIPKISIQTLVENSIIHGMNGQSDRVHIIISCSIKSNFLNIRVHDNGCGIKKERLDYMNSKFENVLVSNDETSCVGLINLNSRLKILYEEKANLYISSIELQETNVVMTIPLNEEHMNV
jgi:two-component system sensor histidine kinase YesM